MTDTPNQDDDVEKLFELIAPFDYAMLVTQTGDGSLRSRPMSPRVLPEDENLWFLTDRESTKIIEVEQSKQVNVSFADPEARIFVSVSGIAEVQSDSSMLDQLWDSEAQVWFPLGKDDPRLTVLKVHPTYAEFWDAPRGSFRRVVPTDSIPVQ